MLRFWHGQNGQRIGEVWNWSDSTGITTVISDSEARHSRENISGTPILLSNSRTAGNWYAEVKINTLSGIYYIGVKRTNSASFSSSDSISYTIDKSFSSGYDGFIRSGGVFESSSLFSSGLDGRVCVRISNNSVQFRYITDAGVIGSWSNIRTLTGSGDIQLGVSLGTSSSFAFDFSQIRIPSGINIPAGYLAW
jgi:hypothetical protein